MLCFAPVKLNGDEIQHYFPILAIILMRPEALFILYVSVSFICWLQIILYIHAMCLFFLVHLLACDPGAWMISRGERDQCRQIIFEMRVKHVKREIERG